MNPKVAPLTQITPGEAYEKLLAALGQVGLDIDHLNHDQSFTRTQLAMEAVTLALEMGKPMRLQNPASQALLAFAVSVEDGILVEKSKAVAGVARFGTGIQMLDAVVAYLRREYGGQRDETASTLAAFADTLHDIADVDEQDRLVAGAHLSSRGNAASTPLQPFYHALATHARITALALALQ